MIRHEDHVWMFNERGELLIAKLSPTGLTILDRCKLIEPPRSSYRAAAACVGRIPLSAEQSVFARNDKVLVRASLAR